MKVVTQGSIPVLGGHTPDNALQFQRIIVITLQTCCFFCTELTFVFCTAELVTNNLVSMYSLSVYPAENH